MLCVERVKKIKNWNNWNKNRDKFLGVGLVVGCLKMIKKRLRERHLYIDICCVLTPALLLAFNGFITLLFA
jgi:hypothetical protein